MGDLNVRPVSDAYDKQQFYHCLFRDLEAFETMLEENLIENRGDRIGAEQELCLVHTNGDPSMDAMKILQNLKGRQFTNELALFNLEINLDPFELHSDCFEKTRSQLQNCITQVRKVSANFDNEVFLCGILPTLKFRHLGQEYMTPVKRYEVLSEVLHQMRGSNFEIYLQGVDELNLSLESVLFEACNTSFQIHLQIDPREFIDQYNWAQIIAGPVLSVCTNSPLLFGRELWSETRIALFKQSLDTRSSKNHLRKKLPRVYFGNRWLNTSPVQLWKNDVMRFPILLTSEDISDSVESLKSGNTPALKAISIHNGTTYTWNRMCYGVSNNIPHLRIECRYLPAGPSMIDEIANMVFWIGIMKGMPESYSKFWKTMDFRIAKSNFIRAARTGLFSTFHWFGQERSAQDLILHELLPMAESGLSECLVNKETREFYLSIIENRAKKIKNGSTWAIENFRNLQHRSNAQIALKRLCLTSIENQKNNLPVSDWEDFSMKSHSLHPYTFSEVDMPVESVMSTDIYTVHPKDCLEFAQKLFEWNQIHHLPVENYEGDLIGIVTSSQLNQIKDEKLFANLMIEDLMDKTFISIHADQKISEAISLMTQNKQSCLPVTMGKRLVGLITITDIFKTFPDLANAYNLEKSVLDHW